LDGRQEKNRGEQGGGKEQWDRPAQSFRSLHNPRAVRRGKDLRLNRDACKAGSLNEKELDRSNIEINFIALYYSKAIYYPTYTLGFTNPELLV